jgi:predicted nuclease with TOPRIM domain
MSEDLTQNLPNTFEQRVLAELSAIRQENAQLSGRMTLIETSVASIDARLVSLEDKVDTRLHETRPIWEGVLERLTNIESELNNLNRQIRALIADQFQLRIRVEKLEDDQQTV